jgi:hypothetical protein
MHNALCLRSKNGVEVLGRILENIRKANLFRLWHITAFAALQKVWSLMDAQWTNKGVDLDLLGRQ